MAYKFQLGEAKLSGSITQTDGTTTLLGLDNSDANATSFGDIELDSLTAEGSLITAFNNVQLSGSNKLQFSSANDRIGIDGGTGDLELVGSGVMNVSASGDLLFSGANIVVDSPMSSSTFISASALVLQDATALAGTALVNSGGQLAVSGLANAQVDANAAIDFSKLAALSSGNILVGNASNQAASVAMSGDIAIANDGETTIQANAVEGSMLNSNTAGDGLAYSSNALNVQVSGALKIASDKVGISGSIAGPGLTTVGGADSIESIDLHIDSLDPGVINVANDSFAFVDADDSSFTKKESIADLMTAVAGDGLAATSGVLAVGVDNSTIEISSDSLQIVNGGVTNVKLANDSVTIGTTEIDLGASSTTLAGMTEIDFAAGNRAIGASIGGNNLTLGGATSTVVVAGNLTVQGTTTTVDSTTINISQSFTFEGPADAHETILHAGTPVKDATIYLPQISGSGDQTGYLLALANDPGTSALTATRDNLDLMAAGAGSSVGLQSGDGLIMFDSSDSNNPKKVLMSDITTLVGNNVATTVQTLTSASESLDVSAGQIVLANRSEDMTITLDTPANHNGKRIVIKRIGDGEVTISANGSENIDGQAGDIVLESTNAAVTIVSDGSNYFVV